MKQILLPLAIFAAIYMAWVVPVDAVACTVNGDCNATTVCQGGSYPICQHQDNSNVVANGGLCTCKDASGSCTTKEECYGSGVALDCPDDARHCYDEKCICDRFPIGK